MGLGDIDPSEGWTFDKDTNSGIVEAMDEYLPERWRKNRVQRRQVYLVVEKYLRTPDALSVEEREKRARKIVADSEGVRAKTIEDATGRRLYTRNYRQNIRHDLEKIERVYKNN